MKRILHHFRRNRTYSHQDRWGVLAGMLILTILVSAGSWLFLGQPAVSASSLEIQNITLSRGTSPADGEFHSQATLTLVDKKASQPAAGVWTSLIIENSQMRTPQFTYFDWYSPEPNRAFYQTDEQGQVGFKLASTIPGEIEYHIYAANPEASQNQKYQNLNSSFTITFE